MPLTAPLSSNGCRILQVRNHRNLWYEIWERGKKYFKKLCREPFFRVAQWNCRRSFWPKCLTVRSSIQIKMISIGVNFNKYIWKETKKVQAAKISEISLQYITNGSKHWINSLSFEAALLGIIVFRKGRFSEWVWQKSIQHKSQPTIHSNLWTFISFLVRPRFLLYICSWTWTPRCFGNCDQSSNEVVWFLIWY